MEPAWTHSGDLGPAAATEGAVAGPVPAAVTGPLDGALSLARAPAFQSVSVEDCSNVQIGDNIHIHGEVTLVLHADATPLPFAQLGVVRDAPSEATEDCRQPGPAKRVQEKSFMKKSLPCVPRSRRRACLALAGMTTVAVVAVTLAIMLTARPLPPDFPGLVTRAEWGAWAARERDVLALPVRTVVVHHTSGYECADRADCIKKVNRLQEYTMDDGWADIPYNFLVGGDGLLYEGRGWCAVGGSVYGWNSEILSFALIGQFDHTSPTPPQRATLLSALQWGVGHGRIHEKYQLAGACQLSANRTSDPGLRFMDDLVTWDHWWKYLKKPGRSCCPSYAPAGLCTG